MYKRTHTYTPQTHARSGCLTCSLSPVCTAPHTPNKSHVRDSFEREIPALFLLRALCNSLYAGHELTTGRVENDGRFLQRALQARRKGVNGEEEEGKEGRVFKEIFPPSRGGTFVNLIRAVKQTYTSAEEEEGRRGAWFFVRAPHHSCVELREKRNDVRVLDRECTIRL